MSERETRESMYDVPCAAQYLDVSTKTIRRYIDSGKITAKKIRNIWYVEKRELDRVRGKVRKKSQTDAAPLAGNPEFMAGMNETLMELKQRMEDIETRLSMISREKGDAGSGEILAAKDSELDNLRRDNERLARELASSRQEIVILKQNGPRDTQVLKNRSEELDELKTTITSNLRGLSLLREEVARQKEEIKRKDAIAADLKARLLELEQELAGYRKGRRQGLFSNLLRTDV